MNFQVFIEATVGSTLQAAFGVDDTLFEISDCETRPTAAIVTADGKSFIIYCDLCFLFECFHNPDISNSQPV